MLRVHFVLVRLNNRLPYYDDSFANTHPTSSTVSTGNKRVEFESRFLKSQFCPIILQPTVLHLATPILDARRYASVEMMKTDRIATRKLMLPSVSRVPPLTNDVRVAVEGERALAGHVRRMTAGRAMPATRERRAGDCGRRRFFDRLRAGSGSGSGGGGGDHAAGIAVGLVHRLLGPAGLLHSSIRRRPALTRLDGVRGPRVGSRSRLKLGVGGRRWPT